MPAWPIQPDLPPGWVAVPRDGAAVVTDRTVRLGPAEGLLERRAEAERLTADVARLEAEAGALQAAAAAAANAATTAREEAERRRDEEAEAAAARRRAEDVERIAVRDHEARLRESGWHQAQAERLDAEVARARAALEALDGTAERRNRRRRRRRRDSGRGGRRCVGGTHRRIAGAA